MERRWLQARPGDPIISYPVSREISAAQVTRFLGRTIGAIATVAGLCSLVMLAALAMGVM